MQDFKMELQETYYKFHQEEGKCLPKVQILTLINEPMEAKHI